MLSKSVIFQRSENLSGLVMTQELEAKWGEREKGREREKRMKERRETQAETLGLFTDFWLYRSEVIAEAVSNPTFLKNHKNLKNNL